MRNNSRPRKPLRANKTKKCQFCSDTSFKVDYKSASQLRRFISERGKMMSRRNTGNCARHQRVVAEHIKRARFMALLHYTADQLR